MKARIAAFLVWALVAACAMYWAMRLLAVPASLPMSVQPVSTASVLRGDIARLFAVPAPVAAAPVEPALASRFRLVGVVAPKDAERGQGQGIALIAVDGKPPRPYRVGASFGDNLLLRAVAARTAVLGPSDGPPVLQLEVPALPPAATGTRPPVAWEGGAGPSAVGDPTALPMPDVAPPPTGDAVAGSADEGSNTLPSE